MKTEEQKRKINAYMKLWYARNKEKVCAWGARYRKNNQAKIKKYHLLYAKKNSAEKVAYARLYRLKNRDAMNANRRRAYRVMRAGLDEIARKREQKRMARRAVASALKIGSLKRLRCINGCRSKAEAHHHDYSQPLKVVWMCKKCHRNHHELAKKQIRSRERSAAESGVR